MKPKTKIQKEVFTLSKLLPNISETQTSYAFRHCFEHVGCRTAKGVITCAECGHKWQGKRVLTNEAYDCTCPHCKTKLRVYITQSRIFKENEYFSVITAFKGYQVIRFFFVRAFFKIGQPPQYSLTEVVQRWISSEGKFVDIARSRAMNTMYYDLWLEGSPMEIRCTHRAYDIMPVVIYPKIKVIPELKRNGFRGEFYDIRPFDLFRLLLSDSHAETLIKVGQYNLLRYFFKSSMNKAENYWDSIRICIRNGYIVEDASLWCDYIDLLKYFGKDIKSPKYVCPDKLSEQHDFYLRKKQKEEKREMARENEKQFRELKANFFGLAFTDGTFQIKVLESVEEYLEEGIAMHHCVFSNDYYLKPDTLILSATHNGKRIETIEISLDSLEVLQSRGVCNKITEYHQKIIDLVEKNKMLIQQRIIHCELPLN